MSLLNGPEALKVHVEVWGWDDLGNPVLLPTGTPVIVRGQVQPVSAEEATHLGQVATTIYRFIGRSFPAGPWSRVEWDGRDWDVHGEPTRSQGSPHTTNVVAYLVARESHVPDMPSDDPEEG